MSRSLAASAVRATAVVAIAGAGLLAGTPALIVPATVAAALSDELLQNAYDLLKEPARALAGDRVLSLVDAVCARLGKVDSPPEERLRAAIAEATRNAVKQLHSAYQQTAHYRSLSTAKAESVDMLFEALWDSTREANYLQNAIQELQSSGQLHALVLGQSRALNAVLVDEVLEDFQTHDADAVSFLQQRLVSNVVAQLGVTLAKDDEKSALARESFYLLQIAWLSDQVEDLRKGQDRHLRGQWAQDTRLQSIETRLQELQELLLYGDGAAPHVEETIQRIVQELVGGTLERPRAFVSVGSERMADYREAASAFLHGISYQVMPPDDPALLPPERQLTTLDDCELFVGIYAHGEGILDDPPPGRDQPLATELLDRARTHFVRCVLFEASPAIRQLTEPEPPPLVLPQEPQPEEMGDLGPEPEKPSRCLSWLIRTAWNVWLNGITPDEQYRRDCAAYDNRRTTREREIQRKHDQDMARHELVVQEFTAIHIRETAVYEGRIARQRELLQQARQRFDPVVVFSSQDDLVRKLQASLYALDRGQRLGFSRETVLARWRAWAARQREALRTHVLYGSPLELPSPAERHLGDVLSSDWRRDTALLAEQVVSCARVIADWGVYDEADREQIERWFEAPANYGEDTYESLRERLQSWCSPRQVSDVSKRLEGLAIRYERSQNPARRNLAPDVRRTHRDWQMATSALRARLDEPAYGRCLLVMGGMGSGKTHLAARLLELHGEAMHGFKLLCLYLARPATGVRNGSEQSLADRLERAIRFELPAEPPGPAWRSFEELVTFARLQGGDQRPAALFVVIDDLDLWVRDGQLDLAHLLDFIDAQTAMPNLYWVFCLSEANYPLIAGSPHGRDLRKYGLPEPRQVAGSTGWLSLADLNTQQAVWQQMMASALGTPHLPQDLVESAEQMPESLLATPFITQIVAELYHNREINATELPNLNFVGFVDRYWNRRLEQTAGRTPLARQSTNWKDWYERTLALLAALAWQRAGQHQEIVFRPGTLANQLVQKDDDATTNFTIDVAEQVVTSLTTDVDVLERPRDPATIRRRGHELRLRVLPVWWWQTAEFLLGKMSDPSDPVQLDRMASWLAERFKPDLDVNYLQGVLEFLVLLAQQASDGEELAQAIGDGVQALPPPFNSVLWLAASKATADQQVALSESLDVQAPALDGKQALHRFLYFLKYAEVTPPGADRSGAPILRMRRLRPQYGAIQDLDQGEYLHSILQHVVASASSGEILARALAHLHGIEDRWNSNESQTKAERLASWTYSELLGMAGEPPPISPSHPVHSWMLAFLAEISRYHKPVAGEYDRHWNRLLRRHCDALAPSLSLEMLTQLEETGWFGWPGPYPGLTDAMLKAMEEQFTTACGVWFREEASGTEQATYVEVVRHCAQGSLDQAQVAAFLVKHTVPAKGPYSRLPVDSRLWAIFEDLRAHPDPAVGAMMHSGPLNTWYLTRKGGEAAREYR